MILVGGNEVKRMSSGPTLQLSFIVPYRAILVQPTWVWEDHPSALPLRLALDVSSQGCPRAVHTAHGMALCSCRSISTEFAALWQGMRRPYVDRIRLKCHMLTSILAFPIGKQAAEAFCCLCYKSRKMSNKVAVSSRYSVMTACQKSTWSHKTDNSPYHKEVLKNDWIHA